jgi:hypothetical protein
MGGLWTNIQLLARVPSAAMRGMRAAKEASYTVIDAAGIERRAEIVSQCGRWPWGRTMPERLASHLAEVEGRMPYAALARFGQYLIGVLQVLFGLSFISCAVNFRGAGFVVAVLVHTLFFVIGVVFFFRARRPAALFNRFTPGALVHHTTEAGFCPACLYDLARTPRGEDGVCVCPECAAAWRMGVSEPQAPRA